MHNSLIELMKEWNSNADLHLTVNFEISFELNFKTIQAILSISDTIQLNPC
jgi:hypothetical protein